jgi:DNA-binding NarL/FixJ family response regulator
MQLHQPGPSRIRSADNWYQHQMSTRAPVRVLIADDHAMTRTGLAELIAGEPDLVVVGTAEDGVRAVELAELVQPDVVLLDLSMPRLDGIRASEQMHRTSPNSRVLVLSSHPDEVVVAAARLAGVSGYLTKDVSCTEVLDGIRLVHAKGSLGSEDGPGR